jgi:hypothetical protein
MDAAKGAVGAAAKCERKENAKRKHYDLVGYWMKGEERNEMATSLK